ncbi:MAG TPA: hypothetical protein PLV58_02030 [Campylobacterales bacterium]|nr:hypothetical protein [Campylobacterales bacterium]
MTAVVAIPDKSASSADSSAVTATLPAPSILLPATCAAVADSVCPLATVIFENPLEKSTVVVASAH